MALVHDADVLAHDAAVLAPDATVLAPELVALVEVGQYFDALSTKKLLNDIQKLLDFDFSPVPIDFPMINFPSIDVDYHYILTQHDVILADQNEHSIRDY